MGVIIYRDVSLGDMLARYYLDEETRNVELQLLPAGMEPLPWTDNEHEIDLLVQVKLAGDVYSGGYAGGVTMRQSLTARQLKLKGQQVRQTPDCCEVITVMQAGHGCLAEHHLLWYTGEKTLRSWVRFVNDGTETVTLELLSSFSLGGLTPYVPGDAHDTMVVHRVRSVCVWKAGCKAIPSRICSWNPAGVPFGANASVRWGRCRSTTGSLG